MNEIMVDIITSAYNHEKYIAQCIESVINQQTNFKFRQLIGEDGSLDRTKEIISAYCHKHPDLIKPFFREKNIGVQQNSLLSFQESDAKYMAFLDGDDYWIDSLKLQKQVDFLEANPSYSMCFTNSLVVDDGDNVVKNERVPEDKKHNLTQSEILSGYCPPGNTVLVKSEFIKKYMPYFSGIMNGDFFLFSLLTQHGDAAYLDINSAAYRVHSNGIWSNKDEDYRLMNYIKVNRKLEELVKPENKAIVNNSIQKSYEQLFKLNVQETFTDNLLWTPQTAMLQAIRDAVIQIDGTPQKALSIDKNPTLEKILLRKWPEMEIIYASYPEYDAQNLHQFADETFDIVFSHQVLEHIPKPWLAATEMNRVLKNDSIGIHTTCAYNPRHGYPSFKDYYRFLPDGLAELFGNVDIWIKDGWGSKQALIYNLTVDDGHGELGGRRFVEALAKQNDVNYPWHTWVIFQKKSGVN